MNLRATAMLLAVGVVVGACTRRAPTEASLAGPEPSSAAPFDAVAAAPSGVAEASAPEAAARVQRRPPPDPAVVEAHPACARVLASSERIARRVVEDDPGRPDWGLGVWYGSEETRRDALAGFGPGCLPQRDGSAWAIELLDAPLRWTIVHYDPRGRRSAVAPVPIDESAGGGMLGPGNSIAYDFDGDRHRMRAAARDPGGRGRHRAPGALPLGDPHARSALRAFVPRSGRPGALHARRGAGLEAHLPRGAPSPDLYRLDARPGARAANADPDICYDQ